MWFVCSVVPLSSTVGGVLESLGAETRGTSLTPERCCSLADLGQVAASCWVVFPHIEMSCGVGISLKKCSLRVKQANM